MLGNLCGDFIKGNPVGKVTDEVAQGVMLHRSIDSFTDDQAEFKAVRALLRPQFKLFSGALVDMFFDHCLAKILNERNSLFYQEHVKQVYHQADIHLKFLPGKFHEVLPYMKKYNWLGIYGNHDDLYIILKQMSQRVDRDVHFETSVEILKTHEEFVMEQFIGFWQKIVVQFESRFLL